MKSQILVVTLLIASACAYAKDFTGQDLKEGLESSELIRAGKVGSHDAYHGGFAEGYIQGFVEATRKEGFYCLPPGDPVPYRTVVDQYLKDHPQQQYELAIQVIFYAFIQMFPCPRKE